MSGDADSVQSGDTDQGADGGDDFVSTYLNEVPEDYRPHVEPYLRNIESNANKRFQEHSEYKKQWEPYEGINLNEYDPEGLQALIQFAEKMGDEEAFDSWLTQAATERGILNGEVDPGLDTGDDFDTEGLTPEAIASIISETLDERLGPIQQKEQAREYQQQVEEADKTIDTLINSLKEEHGDFDENAVYRFAYAANIDDPAEAIQVGFQQYRELVASIENQTVSGKLQVPSAPENGSGPANTSVEPVTKFADAKTMARERLAQMHK